MRLLLLITVLLAARAQAAPVAAAQEAQANPIFIRNPEDITSGDILAGTAGTVGGERLPLRSRMGSVLNDWWNAPHMFGGEGNRYGLRPQARWLKDRGFSFDGNYQGAYFGVVSSQSGSRGFWDGQLNLSGQFNLGDAVDNEQLRGVQMFGAVRYRSSWEESNPNNFVLAQSMFNPSNWQSGTQWRLLNFGLLLDSAKNLPVEHMLTLKLGWLQPQREFADQPLSKLFLNNAVNSAKGLGGNIPFSSSESTWGGTLTVRPQDDFYLRNALFMSFPNPTSSPNHGLMFQGSLNPAQNGLWYMGEGGWTPTFGPESLPGKYAFGGFYYGTPAGQATWDGSTAYGQYGFYAQADQMLFRETSTGPAAELSTQGLKAFNLFFFTTSETKADVYPFYFQSGLVYTGLLPRRDLDLAMISLGCGVYSQATGAPSRTQTAVLEGAYRWQVNGWFYAQPFFQYFSRPDGTSSVDNAGILGITVGTVF
jgi:carbohydrate-selective porin OprB